MLIWCDGYVEGQPIFGQGIILIYGGQCVNFESPFYLKTSQELRMLSRSRLFIQKTKLIKNIYLPVDKDLLSTK